MNKTVNINLAGIFFHIDEDAYSKLQHYLEAIKRSFTDEQGRSEIIADIEARIAELFTEMLDNEKQVISSKQVDKVISIMGQPEDYIVDDAIFEDEPNSEQKRSYNTVKKLFRDTDNSYIGGVSSGLGHYLGIDAIWVRLIWVLLALGSGGTIILIYLLFWILVPEAVTTADKLTMRGEPVNISNIEKKIRDGFDNVSEKVKNVDYEKYGSKIKSNSKSFFETIGDVLLFCLKIFAKFIGIILIVIGASTLLTMLVFSVSLGTTQLIDLPGIDLFHAVNTANTPIWLMTLLLFFLIGIPFFFIFYLGLKILIKNLKSIGNIAKFSLLGLWLISIIGLTIIGVKQASEHAFDASITTTETIHIRPQDTLKIKMVANNSYSKRLGRHSNNFKTVYNTHDEKLLYRTNVRLIIRSTTDSLASIQIEKSAEGSSYQTAKQRAKNINYNLELVGDELYLDGFLTAPFDDKFSDQQVEITLFLPEGSFLYADENTHSYHSNLSHYNDILKHGMEQHILLVKSNVLECIDCNDNELKINIKDKTQLKIGNEGIEAKNNKVNLYINDDGIEIISNED